MKNVYLSKYKKNHKTKKKYQRTEKESPEPSEHMGNLADNIESVHRVSDDLCDRPGKQEEEEADRQARGGQQLQNQPHNVDPVAFFKIYN